MSTETETEIASAAGDTCGAAGGESILRPMTDEEEFDTLVHDAKVLKRFVTAIWSVRLHPDAPEFIFYEKDRNSLVRFNARLNPPLKTVPCVSPTGRTDGHMAYASSGGNPLKCSFCGGFEDIRGIGVVVRERGRKVERRIRSEDGIAKIYDYRKSGFG